MSSANDGISRFSDSTTYGVTTFKQPIVVPSIIYTTPSVGQVGYTYTIPYSTAELVFVSGLPIAYAVSPTIPAGTYIVSVDAMTNRVSAVITDSTIQVLASGVATPIIYRQSGVSTNTDADSGQETVSLSSVFTLTVATTVGIFLNFTFTPPNAVECDSQKFKFLITRLF